MTRKSILSSLLSILTAIVILVALRPFTTVSSQENQASSDATYDIVLTLVKLKDLNGWPKGGGKDSYSGQPLDIENYFGSEASTIDGVAFDIHKDKADGELVQTKITENGGRLIFSGLKAGKYYIVVNKEKSKLAGNQMLGDTTPVPLEVELPVTKPDGSYFTVGNDAVHVYPKQVLKQREDKTSFKVRKEWKGKKLNSITVHLKQNGQVIDEIELSDSNNWEHTFMNLGKTDVAGKDYTYTAEEDVPNGYTATYQNMADKTGTVITNTLVPPTSPRTPIIKTGTLAIYWFLGFAVVLIGIGYKLYKSEKKH